VYITKTNTITKAVTDVKTLWTTLPVTLTKKVDVTATITHPGGATVTDYSTVVVTAPNTVFTEVPPPPATTVVVPTTRSVVPPPSTTTAPPVVTAGANNPKMAPGIALVAGLVGAVALL
jgi:hypothetical protein